MEERRVLLGFSGGIDSSAAVVLLREAGYDVEAVTFDMTGDRDQLHRAEARAAELVVPWRTVDVRERFRKKVSGYFLQSYLRGETPAPCTVCNSEIKWRVLYDLARQEGVGRIATGHYCRVEVSDGKYYIARAADPRKDQSYYLWGLPQSILSRALTPLGNCLKSEIRSRFGIPDRERESMGVCFLGGGTCADWLRRQTPDIPGGEIVDSGGTVIGRHEGIPFYTIGQKRGLTIAPGFRKCGADGRGRPWCVVGIDGARNRLVAGADDDLWRRQLVVSGVRAADPDELAGADDLVVKIRGIGLNPDGYARAEWMAPNRVDVSLCKTLFPGRRMPRKGDFLCGTELGFPAFNGDRELAAGSFSGPDSGRDGFCRMGVTESGGDGGGPFSLRIFLAEPAWAPAVGQPVVLYRGDRVVGGGFLESSE